MIFGVLKRHRKLLVIGLVALGILLSGIAYIVGSFLLLPTSDPLLVRLYIHSEVIRNYPLGQEDHNIFYDHEAGDGPRPESYSLKFNSNMSCSKAEGIGRSYLEGCGLKYESTYSTSDSTQFTYEDDRRFVWWICHPKADSCRIDVIEFVY